MSEIKRLTLISDPTDEFPNNANNSFNCPNALAYRAKAGMPR